MKLYNSDLEYYIEHDFKMIQDMLYTDKIEYNQYVKSLKELCHFHKLKYNFIGVLDGKDTKYYHCVKGDNVDIRFPISKLFIDFSVEKANLKRA